MNQLLVIVQFMLEALGRTWPYLLITIPLAVAVQLSGASRYINRAFQAQPLLAIVLATLVGAFSPFCSCGVIPVIATLLIGGVPLAPVMAFWIASPSMDPETFFLSASVLGWHLALWRLAGTLVLSLSAGFITHFLWQQGWLGQAILRQGYSTEVRSTWRLLQDGGRWLRQRLTAAPTLGIVAGPEFRLPILNFRFRLEEPIENPKLALNEVEGSKIQNLDAGDSCQVRPPSFRQRLLAETWAATTLVLKFMLLAFLLEAIITLYVPESWIIGVLGRHNPWSILTAALLGVPMYTSNLAALPLVGGLLAQGMSPAAALAFLIAGPTTTLPAMAAVWGLVSRRVFALYVSFALVGAIVLGYGYQLLH
ncbi:MAG: permease [Chloroflexi bacterium]|nr:permease [Chloroflexota bacterium]MCI0649961.1 permease [Chloroflexota bacterium]MCI0729291.1 permease [Chloroflexota bacterium]